MTEYIVDIGIILIILMGGVIGIKEGGLKKLVSIIGFILVLVLSYKLKNYLSPIFFKYCPFFKFWKVIKGHQIINILFYEFLSFVIISSVLGIIYHIILTITGIAEKILKATIILSIPSKIIGFILGIVEEYILVFVILTILTLPVFHIKYIENSKIANFILDNTPILTKYTEKTREVYDGVYELVKNENEMTNAEVNKEALILMLDNEIITVDSVDILVEKEKIELKEIAFLDKYRKEE